MDFTQAVIKNRPFIKTNIRIFQINKESILKKKKKIDNKKV